MPSRDSPRFRLRRVSRRRLLAAGITVAAVVAAVGLGLEWRRFGASPEGAIARAAAEVHGRFAEMTAVLGRVATGIATDPAAATALEAGADAARPLFDVVDTHSRREVGELAIAVTIYEKVGSSAVAWAGRPSDLPGERIRGPQAWFVTPSPLGLRLVHIRPIGKDDRPLGVVAVEYPLSPAPAGASIARAEYALTTRVGAAALRMQYEGAGEQLRPNAAVLRAPGGGPLVEAAFTEDQVIRARAGWRRAVAAVVLSIIAVTLLLMIGPSLDRRASASTTREYVLTTAVAAALLLLGSTVIWIALRLAFDGDPKGHGVLLLCGATAAALSALLASPAARLRLAARSRRRFPRANLPLFVLHQLAAGAIVAGIFAAFDFLLGRVLGDASVDLRHFSLHPWSAERLALLGGILAWHLAAAWGATLLLAVSASRWRWTARSFEAVAAMLCWTLPALLVAVVAASRAWPIPALGVLTAAAAVALAGLVAARGVVWFRRATVAARILALFIAFLIPSLLLYPSVNFFTDRTVRTVIATQYSVQARNHYQTLQERLAEARAEIDALPLAEHVRGTAPQQTGAPRTESAFVVWKQTALARERLSAAVELYDASGALLSRFALNFPEYTAATQTGRTAASCHWEVFGEAARFGSEDRRMLHAERSICEGEGAETKVLGAIVVHVVPDYRTLPFITSQSPYFEVFRSGTAPMEGTTGNETAIVIYGWGLTPLYASGAVAWPINDELFERIYRSRDPFWTEMGRGNGRWHVFFSNDRSGIYAIGYPALSLFDRLVHLAELTTLAGAAYVIALLGTAMFTRVSRERPRVGRTLLREIRASFYRKLLLAFVLASIIPVLTLAFVIRAYFAGLLLQNVEAEASRSASVAQRVIEESAAIQQRTGQPVASATDDDMIWISQVIDQDVNVFQGPRLVATSERDLFASGLLPTRTPDHVYRAIALQRLPSFVGEDRIGAVPYMIAGAPVRAGGGDAILTVPLANQQREIEREIDELDRGVHLAALFFILLGAAIGLSMAERIADPVRRLTRATRRIARGDFDERVAVRSVDELRRLVDAFNSMAAELKAQRDQLERTHRLEAWAEMARQVAHEIKNPLTPIQLSAEHLRRVHADRGEPMGPVLESCVTSILGQVRLLRQISSEFSAFATSPTARPTSVDIADLVAEVVNPYRTGLEGRILLRNDVTAPLPPVLVDRMLIARALSNIVENALHAMPGKGMLTLTAGSEDDAVVLRINDSGVGMDEEALERVFEPYFSTKATGTGLGLPIARRNVELSGGTIHVESARGHGTTVVLRLPRVDRPSSNQADADGVS